MQKKTLRTGLCALLAATALMAASCGDDDPVADEGIDYNGSGTSHYRVDYMLTLDDRHVLDVADVAVLYRDSLGQMVADTLDDEAWAKTVNYARTSTIDCTFAAKYTMKAHPQMSQEQYDFGVDMHAPTYRVYANGTGLFLGHMRPHGTTSLLSRDDATLTASYLSTANGRARVDTTMIYLNETIYLSGGSIDSLKLHHFEWPE